MLNFLDMPQAIDEAREEWDYEQSRKTVHLSFFIIHAENKKGSMKTWILTTTIPTL